MTTKTISTAAKDDRTGRPAGVGGPVGLRDALHLLIAAASWFLFFYWWAIVLPQVRREDAVVALLFIAFTTVATGLLTAAWIRYNLDIYRRKGPRLLLTPAAADPNTDALGRTIARPDDASLHNARVVVVAVDGDRKTIGPGGTD